MPDFYMDCDTALSEVPVNLMPLVDSTDFTTIEDAVAYNAAGMALRWHFVTSAGSYTVTSVTPTTGGDYDWTDQGDSGIYTIEIPASGGASINNDTEGYGWFTGKADGILPWRGPVIGFRAAGLNDALMDSAYSTTRGLAGTALPNAAADAAGGLPISDAGGLDLDTQLGKLVGTLATGTHNPQSGDAYAYLGTNLGALGANATEAGGTGDHLTALATQASVDAVPTAAENAVAIEAAILNEGDATALLAAIAAKVEEFLVADGDATATLAAIATAVWGNGTRTLTANTNLNDPTAAAIADAVWDEATTSHTTSGTFGEQVKTDVDAIKAKTDNLPADPAGVSDIPTVSDIWTTALTEAYRATGATGTAAQLLYEIIAHLGNSSITDTTKTLTKLDKSTTAKTYTLDDATSPTSVEELS